MFRKTLAVATLAALLGTSAIAAVEKVKEVTVTADITAIQNEQAAAYWANIATDLQGAIAARLTDRLAEEGASILIDIREVELANSFERALNLSDAVLVGQVNINDQSDNSNYDAYELQVSLEGAKYTSVGTEGTIMLSTIDTPEAYQSLIDRFAEEVVERLK